MKSSVKITRSFNRQAKPLLKKYASLSDELEQLYSELAENPYLGTKIMEDVYKIRIGKSEIGNISKSEILKLIENMEVIT
jgi:mRNA-degrading endonuclease RelE of RelBE toxin-antitoxin system